MQEIRRTLHGSPAANLLYLNPASQGDTLDTGLISFGR